MYLVTVTLGENNERLYITGFTKWGASQQSNDIKNAALFTHNEANECIKALEKLYPKFKFEILCDNQKEFRSIPPGTSFKFQGREYTKCGLNGAYFAYDVEYHQVIEMHNYDVVEII